MGKGGGGECGGRWEKIRVCPRSSWLVSSGSFLRQNYGLEKEFIAVPRGPF